MLECKNWGLSVVSKLQTTNTMNFAAVAILDDDGDLHGKSWVGQDKSRRFST